LLYDNKEKSYVDLSSQSAQVISESNCGCWTKN